MGLTSSYQKFMRNVHQGRKQFHAEEADGVNDAASFSHQFRQHEKEGLLEVELHAGDRMTLHKTQKYYQQEAELSEHPNTPTLDQSEKSAAEVAKTPWRVSLESMKDRVDTVEYLYPESIPHMTIAVVLLKNGYALQGMSAPADPANFNEEKGKEFAYEDAMRKLWALEAYVMREYITGNIHGFNPAERWVAT